MEKDINHPVGREQELFPIIRRFCTEQTCYQGLKPDDQVSRYYKNTTQLLVEDLLKETPDPDDTYTIATNYGNSVAWVGKVYAIALRLASSLCFRR